MTPLLPCGVLVHEAAVEHPGDDLHVAVRVRLEPDAGRDDVVVGDQQQPEVRVGRVVVVGRTRTSAWSRASPSRWPSGRPPASASSRSSPSSLVPRPPISGCAQISTTQAERIPSQSRCAPPGAVRRDPDGHGDQGPHQRRRPTRTAGRRRPWRAQTTVRSSIVSRDERVRPGDRPSRAASALPAAAGGRSAVPSASGPADAAVRGARRAVDPGERDDPRQQAGAP